METGMKLIIHDRGTLGCRKEGFLEEVTQVFTKKNRVGKGSRSRGNAISKSPEFRSHQRRHTV